jgi:hypothetical protein
VVIAGRSPEVNSPLKKADRSASLQRAVNADVEELTKAALSLPTPVTFVSVADAA